MQLVEIAKALSLRSRVLLLDEPTASLTPHETEHPVRAAAPLRDDGVTIVFVSHKLEEVLALCDTVTVLRDGRNACASRPMAGLGRQDLVRLMIGRNEQIPAWSRARGEPRDAGPGIARSCDRVRSQRDRPHASPRRDRRPLWPGRGGTHRARQMPYRLASRDRGRVPGRWAESRDRQRRRGPRPLPHRLR